MADEKTKNPDGRHALAGWFIILSFVVAVAGLLGCLFAAVRNNDFTSAGLCLLPSAVVLGLLANAMFRD